MSGPHGLSIIVDTHIKQSQKQNKMSTIISAKKEKAHITFNSLEKRT